MDYDPISSLEAIGYLEREASFLYLVAVHSGYFLRRQYNRFAGRDGGTALDRMLRKADRHNHIQVIECGRGWHIYHLKSRRSTPPSSGHTRRTDASKGDAHIKSRLMVLDFVLAHLSAKHCSLKRSTRLTLHHAVWRPLGAAASQSCRTPDVFLGWVPHPRLKLWAFHASRSSTKATASRFERYLKQYQPLLRPSASSSWLMSPIPTVALPEPKHLQPLPARRPPAGSHCRDTARRRSLLEYLAVRQQSEVGGRGVWSSDLKTLREGESLYTSLEHQALYSAWKAGSTTVEKIRQRFLQTSMRVTFSTVVLPYRYPLDPTQHEPHSDEADDTHHHTRHDTPSEEDK